MNNNFEEFMKEIDKVYPIKYIPKENVCPPQFGSCPMMFYCIPNGKTVKCPSCGKSCSRPNISF